MDKNREPLTLFRWRKDSAGYEFAPYPKIVRRGGAMVEYDPATVMPPDTPPLHYVFANYLSQQRDIAENEGRELADEPSAPFYRRGFQDVPSVLLAFVNEYGFLGSDRSGADADFEDANYLMKLSENLRDVMMWSKAFAARVPPQELAPLLGGTALAGPTLRMYFGPGPHHGRAQVHYEPETLYAWMWLRTADDLSRGVVWSGAPCLYCSNPMGRGPGAYRPQAEFCSDKCRTYFHRLSRKEQRTRKSAARAYARNQQGI